jgi:hypothetical protein
MNGAELSAVGNPTEAELDWYDRIQAERFAAAKAQRRAEENRCRPSILLGAEIESFLTESGEIRFAVSYSGLRETGETPEIACDNFDHLWLNGSD